jgi:hypothetical protein
MFHIVSGEGMNGSISEEAMNNIHLESVVMISSNVSGHGGASLELCSHITPFKTEQQSRSTAVCPASIEGEESTSELAPVPLVSSRSKMIVLHRVERTSENRWRSEVLDGGQRCQKLGSSRIPAR